MIEKESSTPTWDRIIERDQDATKDLVSRRTPRSPRSHPKESLTLAVFAAAWADALCIVGVCTLALATLLVMGHHANLKSLPWGLGVGTLWWAAAAASTLVVRRGTPGMLMAGVVSSDSLEPKRVPLTIVVALLNSLLGGTPAIIGAQRSLLRRAVGHRLISSEHARNDS